MTRAVYQPLHSSAHPQRQPYVRAVSFVDTKGPPPFDYYDQFQDHFAALAGARAGRSHSLDSDEFTEAWFRSGYFGQMFIDRNIGGMTVAPDAMPDEIGIHGAASALSGVAGFSFAIRSGEFQLDADFLLTVKVKLVNPQSLNSALAGGFVASVGDAFLGTPHPPGFAAGGDTQTWRLVYALDGTSPRLLYDTGIPCLPGVWYRLQVSRINGAVRWFVNGINARLNGLEGIYYPVALPGAKKWIEINRSAPGAANEGMIMDSAHLLAQRIIS